MHRALNNYAAALLNNDPAPAQPLVRVNRSLSDCSLRDVIVQGFLQEARVYGQLGSAGGKQSECCFLITHCNYRLGHLPCKLRQSPVTMMNAVLSLTLLLFREQRCECVVCWARVAGACLVCQHRGRQLREPILIQCAMDGRVCCGCCSTTWCSTAP
jgi:hypothetical protein